MNNNQQLDNLLDQALSAYREAEPLAGIEDRVLQRLRMQPKESRTAWWKWAALAMCAAVLAFAVWLGSRSHAPQGPVARQQTQARNVNLPPEAKPAAKTSRAVTNRHAPQVQIRIQARVSLGAGTPAQLGRLDDNRRESPHMAAPLTGEERQLLALAQSHLDALRAISAEDQPIAIAPLTIQPLPSQANQNGDN